MLPCHCHHHHHKFITTTKFMSFCRPNVVLFFYPYIFLPIDSVNCSLADALENLSYDTNVRHNRITSELAESSDPQLLQIEDTPPQTSVLCKRTRQLCTIWISKLRLWHMTFSPRLQSYNPHFIHPRLAIHLSFFMLRSIVNSLCSH